MVNALVQEETHYSRKNKNLLKRVSGGREREGESEGERDYSDNLTIENSEN